MKGYSHFPYNSAPTGPVGPMGQQQGSVGQQVFDWPQQLLPPQPTPQLLLLPQQPLPVLR